MNIKIKNINKKILTLIDELEKYSEYKKEFFKKTDKR